MQDTARNLLQLYVEDLKSIYGQHLRTVILYGSYARGDYTKDSDIDIMILVDLPEKEISEKSRTLSDVTFDYNFDHDLEIMPIVKNTEHFNKWLRAYPFYNNVKREGIELYAA
ncbi:MAG: nucleotidyltransferase domain-containing protein [Oscillospiraceae bacterium]|nr:nucleotidyltransferase domain-containing protein [Oscillospiraceae bacterium]